MVMLLYVKKYVPLHISPNIGHVRCVADNNKMIQLLVFIGNLPCDNANRTDNGNNYIHEFPSVMSYFCVMMGH